MVHFAKVCQQELSGRTGKIVTAEAHLKARTKLVPRAAPFRAAWARSALGTFYFAIIGRVSWIATVHHRPLRVANPFYSRGRFDEVGERGVNG
jgi:hypothetical protein